MRGIKRILSIFFHDTMIRGESNYVIVINARHKKNLGEDIFFHDTMIRHDTK